MERPRAGAWGLCRHRGHRGDRNGSAKVYAARASPASSTTTNSPTATHPPVFSAVSIGPVGAGSSRGGGGGRGCVRYTTGSSRRGSCGRGGGEGEGGGAAGLRGVAAAGRGGGFGAGGAGGGWAAGGLRA